VRVGIFNLPPLSGRKYSESFLFWNNTVPRDRISDPDFYIIYRVGIVTRLWALMLSAIALGIAYAHHYFDVFPQITPFYDKPTFLGTFVGLLNIAGRFMAVILLYYAVLFSKNVCFRRYNPLRYDYQTMKGQGLKPLLQFYAATILLLCLLIYFGYAFAYFTTLENSRSIYNSVAFVSLLAAFSGFSLSLVSQVLFEIGVRAAYITYERMNHVR
jgi:hypothetical protein